MKRLVLSLLMAAAFLTVPAFVHGLVRAEDPPVLADSDTSSLGVEMLPEETPFMLRCTNAKEFVAALKRFGAEGMIVGEDMLDGSLLMVFRFKDGSLSFVRSNRRGTSLCIFGSVARPDIDLGVVLGGRTY
jgi:hypothetical protein